MCRCGELVPERGECVVPAPALPDTAQVPGLLACSVLCPASQILGGFPTPKPAILASLPLHPGGGLKATPQVFSAYQEAIPLGASV